MDFQSQRFMSHRLPTQIPIIGSTKNTQQKNYKSINPQYHLSNPINRVILIKFLGLIQLRNPRGQ